MALSSVGLFVDPENMDKPSNSNFDLRVISYMHLAHCTVVSVILLHIIDLFDNASCS
jgi:hypothetical protein